MRARNLLRVSALLLLWSCDVTSPTDDLTSEVHVAPAQIQLGQTVRLTVATTNTGDQTVVSLHGCGEGITLEIKYPDGITHHPFRDGPQICPMFDSNHIEPAETDTVSYEWQPPITGVYTIRGGLWTGRGIAAASSPKVFEVR